MNIYHYIGIGFFIFLVVWLLGSYFVVRSVEEPKFTVVEQRDGYDIREYAPYIIAETEVSGNYTEATNKGFSVIADYIFGNNTTQTSISMTTPVLEQGPKNDSEEIAMTVPVIDTQEVEGTRTISFVLPSEYTMETLPLPNNPSVKLREVPAHKVAVLSFTWYPTTKRVDQKKEVLKNLLERDGVKTSGEVQVARYNPPLSMPLILRNEILIPIE